MTLKYLETLTDLTLTTLLIRRTSSTMSLWIDEMKFKPHNLSFTYARVMTVLYDEVMTFTELVEATVMPASTVSRVVKRMEKEGFLKRERDKHEKRRINLFLTESGLTRRTEVLQYIAETGEALLGHLPQEDIDHLNRITTTILRHVKEKYRGYTV